CEILGGSLALSRHGIYSTATPWTDVNFVDDQFLRTLGNTLFSFLGFGGTFQSEVLVPFFRSNDSLDVF
ncbi:hypothetical protein RhiirA5_507188, partial [Rhizophagus irregularis]